MHDKLAIRKNPDAMLETPGAAEDDPDEAVLSKKRRRMRFSEERALHWIKIVILVCAIIYALSVVGCYFCYLVLPTSCRWLTEAQIAEIKDVAITISAGVIVSLCISLLMPYKTKG